MRITDSINVTSSQEIHDGRGLVHGIIVNSHSNGTLKLWHHTAAAGTFIMDTFSFPTGSGMYMFPYPIEIRDGLYATVGGTLNCQVLITKE